MRVAFDVAAIGQVTGGDDEGWLRVECADIGENGFERRVCVRVEMVVRHGRIADMEIGQVNEGRRVRHIALQLSVPRRKRNVREC